MKVLMLSIDPSICESGSPAGERMRAYGGVLEELHIVVYTRRHAEERRLAPNVYVYPAWASNLGYVWHGYRLCRRILERSRCDIVTSQDAFTNVVAFLLRARFGIKVQVQIHTDFFSRHFTDSLKNRARYIMYKASVRHADCIRVVSDRVKKGLVSILRIPENRIFVLPVFTKYQGPENFRKREGHRVLMLSRLAKEKRIYRGIQAYKLLRKKYPDAVLTIVGEGPKREELGRLARGEEHITFVGWTDSPMEYYAHADVLLVTSAYEGYGLTIAEALSAGLPVVSTDVGVARDLGAHIVSEDTPRAICDMLSFVFEKRPVNSRKAIFITSIDEHVKQFRKSLEVCML